MPRYIEAIADFGSFFGNTLPRQTEKSWNCLGILLPTHLAPEFRRLLILHISYKRPHVIFSTSFWPWLSNSITISFDKLNNNKLPKICFLYTLCKPNEKQPKFDASLHFCYTIYSLMCFPFEKYLTDNLKTCGLIYLQ